jgi:hypothetical protein
MRALPKAVLVMAVLLVAGAADAQTRPPRPSPVTRPRGPARFELSAGVGVDTAVSLGERLATLRGAGNSPFPLFGTSSELAAAMRIEGRIGYAITPAYAVEGQFGFVRPRIRTAISGDVEGGAGESASGEIDQYSLSAGMAVRLPVTFAGLTPFLTGGAGYVRELRENLPPIENGYLVYAGGGVRRALVTRADRFLRTVGVRGDVRWQRIESVVRVLERPRSQAAISASLFVTF